MAQSQHLNQAFQNAAFPSTSSATFSHLVSGSNGPAHGQILDAGLSARNDYARYPTNDMYSKQLTYLNKDPITDDKVPGDDVLETRDETFAKPAADDFSKNLNSDYPKHPSEYSKVSTDPSSTNWSPSHSSLNMTLPGLSGEYKYMNEPYNFPNVPDPLSQHNYPSAPNPANKYWI